CTSRSKVCAFASRAERSSGNEMEAFMEKSLGLEHRVNEQAGDRGESHDHRLGKFLQLPEQHDRNHEDEDRGDVGDGALAQDHHGAGDGSYGGSSDAVDESDDAGLL